MLSIFHIGSRDGFVPFDYPEIFDSCCEFIMIDAADVGDINSINLLNGRTAYARARQIKAAVWNKSSQQQLNLTACPYAASIKKLDKKFNEWYVFANGNCDYILGEAHALINSESVVTKTLDTIISDSDLPAPAVLCVDAQGSTLEILQGVVLNLPLIDAIVCEVELIPFYGENPSFSGVLNLLASKGMIFSGFIDEPVSWASPVRHPIGCRSKTMLGSADAVFIRNPDEISQHSGHTRVLNYALICCALGHLDLALAALRGFNFPLGVDDSENPIHEFCSDLSRASQAMPSYFPPSFSEMRIGPEVPPIDQLLLSENTPLENCLRDYRFLHLADAVKSLRLEQVSRISSGEGR